MSEHATTRGRGTRWLLGIALVVLVLDQLTKWWVRRTLAAGEMWPSADHPLATYFTFTHVHNTGVAFGLFQGRSLLFAALAVVIIVALLAYHVQLPPGKRWLRAALGLQVGGAVGNLIDRLHQGYVTDFLDFKVWPVFNVADSAIVLGVLGLAWHLWQVEQQTKADARHEVAAAVQTDAEAAEPSATDGPALRAALEERGD